MVFKSRFGKRVDGIDLVHGRDKKSMRIVQFKNPILQWDFVNTRGYVCENCSSNRAQGEEAELQKEDKANEPENKTVVESKSST